MRNTPEYSPEYAERRRQLMAFANAGVIPPGIDIRNNGVARQYNKAHGGKPMTQQQQDPQDLTLPDTVSDLFPSKWLNAGDLNGRTFDLTISRIDGDMFPIHPRTREKELKAVVYFEKARKGLILNATQATQIAEIAGSSRFTDWPGTRVTLAPGTAPNGKPTITIRTAPAPADSVPAPPEDPAPVPSGRPLNEDLPTENPPDENGIFDQTYKSGDPVSIGHRSAFTTYRRAHAEDVPENFATLKKWVDRLHS
jgi:hypothetical protein